MDRFVQMPPECTKLHSFPKCSTDPGPLAVKGRGEEGKDWGWELTGVKGPSSLRTWLLRFVIVTASCWSWVRHGHYVTAGKMCVYSNVLSAALCYCCRGCLEKAIELFNRAIDLSKTEAEMAHLFSLLDAAIAQSHVAKYLGIQLPSMMWCTEQYNTVTCCCKYVINMSCWMTCSY